MFALAVLVALVPFEDGKPSGQAALVRLAQDYSLTIEHERPSFPARTTWGPIQGKRPGRKNIERYAPLFLREFALLPKALVEKATLKRVVFCEELSLAGQHRNAVPDWEHDVLYLEVSRGSHAPRYLAAVIHHEFFHLVDYRDDGQVYQDDAWAALNPKGFTYGSGGKNWQGDKRTTALTAKHPGFLTHYGTTGVKEDKAELYAHLIVNPGHVKERCKEDAVLRAKVTRLKQLLAAFCPDVNEAFWQRAERLERPGM